MVLISTGDYYANICRVNRDRAQALLAERKD
jgi:hypothetical protein